MSDPAVDPDRIRQSERTVDNLKRLYAVLFAISFAILAQGIAQKLTSVLNGEAWTLGEGLLHLEVTLVFALTAGLFYYQSDRFLDVSFAKSPLPEVSAAGFAFSYLVNVVTMAPFYLMAFALSPDVSRSAMGFSWYILAYLALIANGLVWLYISSSARAVFRLHELDDRVAALNTFWMLMNSILLLIAVALLAHFVGRHGLCVAGETSGAGLKLVALFGLLILVRDAFDFVNGWPLLYPVADADAQIDRRPWLRLLIAHRRWRLAAGWIAVAITVGSFALLWNTGLVKPGALRAACAVAAAPTQVGATADTKHADVKSAKVGR